MCLVLPVWYKSGHTPFNTESVQPSTLPVRICLFLSPGPSTMLQAQFYDTYFESDSETGPHYVALTVLELICTI